MDQLTKTIDELMKELDKAPNQEEVKLLLGKKEYSIMKQEEETKVEETKARNAHKFNRDKIDYEYGMIYTFARKYDTQGAK
ncbi:hypothetical protein NDU88_003891 [Pleurodeles waltl]|uniref:Uncharacterized protein n=1 Tax=Pleurodeles waltl TaxID=8319 RepID=A0AAV7WUB3_PLEWA|nr:hypothetical protein NDU88_003891 [Pleurodeles waltl]